MCIFSVTWFSEYNTLTVTKHFEKVVYIYNKSAFEQRENCILKAKKGSINFFFFKLHKYQNVQCQVGNDIIEVYRCFRKNFLQYCEHDLGTNPALHIFFISNRKLFFFVKFLFSIFLGLWYNNVNFCYRCSMILLYSKYIQRANQKCSSYFDLLHVCCKL